MYNAVEFERVPVQDADEWVGGTVFIVPSQVVKVEPYAARVQGIDTRITLTEGEPEIVEGPPSEINRRLRSGT